MVLSPCKTLFSNVLTCTSNSVVLNTKVQFKQNTVWMMRANSILSYNVLGFRFPCPESAPELARCSSSKMDFFASLLIGNRASSSQPTISPTLAGMFKLSSKNQLLGTNRKLCKNQILIRKMSYLATYMKCSIMWKMVSWIISGQFNSNFWSINTFPIFFLNMNFYQTKREGFDNLNDTFGLHMILKVPDTNAFKTAQFHILYKYVWLSVTQKTPGVIDL